MQDQGADAKVFGFFYPTSGMQEIAADPDFESEFLGGQNPYALFSKAASS